MKRTLAILVLVLGGLTATTTSALAGAAPPRPTQAQLQQLILTRADVGTSFSLAQSGPLQDGVNSYGVIFTRDSGWVQVVAAGLFDLRAGSPRENALGFIEGATGSRQAVEMTAPRIGSGTVRYTFSYRQDGQRIYGDVIAWQQDGVVAVVGVLSEDPEDCACQFAQKQQAKLSAPVRRT